MYLAPVVVFIFFNCLFVQIFKKKFGMTVPFTWGVVFLVLYFTQFLFKTFNVGLAILWIGAAAGLLLLIIKRKQTHLFFSPGLVAFFIVCLLVFFWDFHRYLTDFDEFWFWGITIKESLRLDRFYCIDLSNVPIHKDYPPFQTIIELFWCKTSGFYNEGIASMGLHIFAFSFFTPVLAEIIWDKNENEKSGIKRVLHITLTSVLLILLSVSVVTFLDFKNTVFTLLTDIPQAFAFAFILYWIISEEAYKDIFGFFNALAICIAFPMIKQVGLAFLLFIVCLYAYNGILKKIKLKALISQILTLIVVPIGVFGIWKMYIKYLGVTDMRALEGGTGQFDVAKVNIYDLVLVLLGKKPGIMQDTLKNYYEALISRNISSSTWLNLTFLSSFLLVILIIIFLSKRYSAVVSNIQFKSLFFGSIFSTIGFAVGQGVLFLFCFTQDEMRELRGFERYMDSLFLGEILGLIMLFVLFEHRLKKDRKQILSTLLIMFAVICIFFSQNNMIRLIPKGLSDDPLTFYRVEGEKINTYTEANTKVTPVYDTSMYTGWYGGYQSYVSYYTNDKKLLWGTNLFSLDYENEEARDLALQQIKESDYIYFLNTSDNMRSFYNSMIEDGELGDNMFYRVVVTDDKVVLVTVK